MQKIFSRSNVILLVLFVTINTMVVSPICSAEEYTFVDADGDTGYYLDNETVNIESQDIIVATVAVVKANLNKMYIYNVRINHKDKTYQINSSKILEYDTRNILESNDRIRPFRPYASKSEMSELVRFILQGGDLVDR